MLLLPVFNATLQPCAVSPAAFRPHAQGRFCDSCQRLVHDFSQSTAPAADLAAARAAAPDGRVCGSFRKAQVLVVAPLSRRLRWFLVALVLVVAQGLTAREALAQVRQAAKGQAAACRADRAPLNSTQDKNLVYGAVMEQMPVFQHGGGNREVITYIQQRVVWPRQNGKIVAAEGRLFVTFTVDIEGRVRNAKVIKSFNQQFDEPVLRVVRSLPPFKSGSQNGQTVPVGMTLPITFRLK